MRPTVWLRDLGASLWRLLVGIAGAALTATGLVTIVVGSGLAAAWVFVVALTCLLIVVLSAYVRAAQERDALPVASQSDAVSELQKRIRELEASQLRVVDNGNGTIGLFTAKRAIPTK